MRPSIQNLLNHLWEEANRPATPWKRKAAIVGGGALAASVFMLTLESLVTIWSPEWAIVVFYAALVLVLLIRPTGFFGRQPVRAQ